MDGVLRIRSRDGKLEGPGESTGAPPHQKFYFVDTGRKDEASGNNWIPLDENGNNKRRKLFSCVRLVKELKENNVPSFIHVSELA